MRAVGRPDNRGHEDMTSDDFDWADKTEANPGQPGSGTSGSGQPGPGRPAWPEAGSGQPGWPEPDQGPQYGQGAEYPQYGQPGQPQYGQGPQYGAPQYGPTQPGQLPQYADYGQAGQSPPGQGQYGQGQPGPGQYGQGQPGPGQYGRVGPYPQQYGPYGVPPGQIGYGRRNPFAITSLVLGCVQVLLFWIVFLWPILAIGAIVFGGVALRQMHRRGDRGRGMAVSGIVLGSIGLLFFLAVVGLVVGHVSHG
jgi:Domain of unknown function (DUF4190)